MNYNESLMYINNIERFGMKPGLETIRELLKRMDNPQDSLKFIHIAGTNGKGSVASFISNVLKEAGINAGLYTSPYLERFNERIRINGEEIDDEDLACIVTYVADICKGMIEDGFPHPTEFEFNTAVAFKYYKEKKAEVVVLEVGLGGRLDATNIISKPLLAIITSVSMDHMSVLGDSLEKIAYEKAGIIKQNSDTLVYSQKEECMKVFRDICLERNSSMYISNNESIEIEKSNANNQVFTFEDVFGCRGKLKIRMIGEYQCRNALLAYNALKIINEKNLLSKKIDEQTIEKGLLEALWPARFEIMSDKPLFVIDGAHNEDGAANFVREVERLFGKETYYRTLVTGMLEDKDVDRMVKIMAPAFDRVIVTLPESERAMKVERLAYRMGMYLDDIICIEDIDEAVRYALETNDEAAIKDASSKTPKSGKGKKNKKEKIKPKKGVVFAAGSLYMAGKARSFFRANYKK